MYGSGSAYYYSSPSGSASTGGTGGGTGGTGGFHAGYGQRSSSTSHYMSTGPHSSYSAGYVSSPYLSATAYYSGHQGVSSSLVESPYSLVSSSSSTSLAGALRRNTSLRRTQLPSGGSSNCSTSTSSSTLTGAYITSGGLRGYPTELPTSASFSSGYSHYHTAANAVVDKTSVGTSTRYGRHMTSSALPSLESSQYVSKSGRETSANYVSQQSHYSSPILSGSGESGLRRSAASYYTKRTNAASRSSGIASSNHEISTTSKYSGLPRSTSSDTSSALSSLSNRSSSRENSLSSTTSGLPGSGNSSSVSTPLAVKLIAETVSIVAENRPDSGRQLEAQSLWSNLCEQNQQLAEEIRAYEQALGTSESAQQQQQHQQQQQQENSPTPESRSAQPRRKNMEERRLDRKEAEIKELLQQIETELKLQHELISENQRIEDLIQKANKGDL